MFRRGPQAILVMLMLALGLAAFAWRFRLQQTDQALAFWGAEAAWLVRRAPEVEVSRLRPAESTGESQEVIELAGRRFAAHNTRDISRAAGVIHARNALIQDASFAWNQAATGDPPKFDYLLRFRDGSQQAKAALDLDGQRLYFVGGSDVSIAPISAGLKKLLDRQFVPAAQPKP